GPPHSCGGALHLRAFYLLTRPSDKAALFTFSTTLGAGLDQLVKSGSFALRRPAVCALRRTGDRLRAPSALVHRARQVRVTPAAGRRRRLRGVARAPACATV